MPLTETHGSSRHTQIMLIALQAAARGSIKPDGSIQTVRATLGSVPLDKPVHAELREELGRGFQELAMAALVDPDGTGTFTITPRGIALLRTHPRGIDRSLLERYMEYRDYITTISHPRQPAENGTRENAAPRSETAYLDGAISYRRGFDRSDNPYGPDLDAHRKWEDGWNDAHTRASRHARA